MCQRRQKSGVDVARKGRSKLIDSSNPSMRATPRAMSV